MQTATLDQPMAKKPKTLSVKLDMDVVESARIVAAYHPDKTMTELLSELLRPLLAKMEQEAVEKRARTPKGKESSK